MSQINKLVKELLEIFDTIEESDSGLMFHPVQISSCRVMLSKRVNEILVKLKELL